MAASPLSLYERRLGLAGLVLQPAPPASLPAGLDPTATSAWKVGEVDLLLLAFPSQSTHEAAVAALRGAGWFGAGASLHASSGGVLLLLRAPSEAQRAELDRIAQAFAGEE